MISSITHKVLKSNSFLTKFPFQLVTRKDNISCTDATLIKNFAFQALQVLSLLIIETPTMPAGDYFGAGTTLKVQFRLAFGLPSLPPLPIDISVLMPMFSPQGQPKEVPPIHAPSASPPNTATLDVQSATQFQTAGGQTDRTVSDMASKLQSTPRESTFMRVLYQYGGEHPELQFRFEQFVKQNNARALGLTERYVVDNVVNAALEAYKLTSYGDLC